MFENINKSVMLLALVLMLLVLVPTCFASENETVIGVNEDLDSQETVIMADGQSNHYYFDASLENDSGDGSFENPYKYFTSSRVRANSNIHLADGEYELDSRVNIERVNIIGSNSSRCILKFDGVAFYVYNSLTLTNLTLVDLSIQNYANLNVTDCIFTYGYGSIPDSYGNNYGGAIYSPYRNGYTPNVVIRDSVFTDNFAVYGGAIYMDGGRLDIQDSTFINNFAMNYGGTIACEGGTNVTLLRTNIFNSKSLCDAGGAIYLKKSSLKADYLNITGTSATFGSAITALKSQLDISHSYFENNTAQYSGGAVFQMYGDFSSTYNMFRDNSAKNGGAVYIDNLDSVFLRMNTFKGNNASQFGGALYSLLNEFSYSPFYMNTYTGNHAGSYEDVFESDSLNLFIGNGNYTMFRITPANITGIPSRYSMLDDNLLTIPKDQEGGGSCWAFASMAVIESCIIKAGGPVLDLSEENMKNLMALYGDYGWIINDNEGGYSPMPVAYLTSWLGPILDQYDYYDDHSALSEIFNGTIHIQNILFLSRNNYTDNNAIKEAILKYGAVATGMKYSSTYFRGQGYYCWSNEAEDHEVCIVGWDDDYSASNFYGSPEGDGAWLVRNSWGPDWNGNGYFYVSYYDKSFAKPGSYEVAYTIILNDTVRFDKNYQYDIAGYNINYCDNEENVYYRNVFNATDDEYLAGISTYFRKTTNWTASVYVNGVLKTNLSGVSPAGYYTFNLNDLVRLNKGDTFDVVFHLIGANSFFHFLSNTIINNPLQHPGISFMSYDGENWTDLYYYNITIGNKIYTANLACIKAFTILNEINTTLALSGDDVYLNIANITAIVADQYGNIIKSGNVTFNIEGVDYVVNITDGAARITHTFTTNSSLILASFAKTGYVGSDSSMILEIPPVCLDLSDSVYINYRNATVQVITSEPINETVVLSIKGKTYTQNLINGIACFNLTDLANDNYDFEISLGENVFFKADAITDSFEIFTDFNTTISLDIECEWVNDVNITARVTDQFGDAVLNGEITFTIEGVDYTFDLINGTAFISHNFTSNQPVIEASFNGFAYNSSHISQILNIPKRTVALNDSITVVGRNATILITSDKPINETVIVLVGGDSHTANLVNGEASLNLTNLENGNYTVTVYLKDNIYYEATPEEDLFEILIRNTFIHAGDMETCYNSGVLYNVTLVDDWNNPVVGKKLFISFNKSKKYQITTNSNGVASIPINLGIGTYSVDVEFEGDIYHVNSTNSSKITVKSSIEPSKATKYTYNSKFTATLYDKDGLSVNKKANIIVCSSTYSPVSNGKGQISLNLCLKPGKYTISVVNLQTGEVKTQTIQVVARIGENKDVTKYYGGSQVYRVRAFNDNGNPVGAGEIVKITVSGKNYNAKTDKNGYASLAINLKPNTYPITAEYKGYKVSNKVIVKPTLITSNMDVKKGTTIKYYAKLLDSNGKIQVNKLVKFKFNGKTYSAKTSAYGYAIIYIANSLKAGKYNVVTTYGTMTNTNVITIK